MKEESLYPEFCDPFDNKKENFWMKIEHYGRYLFFTDMFKNKNIIVGDFGCANGYGSNLISNHVKKLYSYDVNIDYINIAKNLNYQKNIKYDVLDFNSNFNINIKFDYMCCFETLEHLEKPYQFLKKLYTLLNNNGKLILSIPNSNYELLNEYGKSKDKYHKQVFDINNLIKRINDIGFIVEDIYGQSITNMILNNEYNLIKEENINYNNPICYYNYDSETIKYFAKIIAYPNKLDIIKTYSYIIILTKKAL